MPGFGRELGGGAARCWRTERRSWWSVQPLLVRVAGGGGLFERVLGARVGEPAAARCSQPSQGRSDPPYRLWHLNHQDPVETAHLLTREAGKGYKTEKSPHRDKEIVAA
jgi:hypothetical protein